MGRNVKLKKKFKNSTNLSWFFSHQFRTIFDSSHQKKKKVYLIHKKEKEKRKKKAAYPTPQNRKKTII